MTNVRSIIPLPPADFTEELGNYKTLKPFRLWCQKVLPLVYDDSLSYYELLCKVVDYLNKTMEDVETLHGDVTNLYTAYEKLQSYVNNYFSTLDVQEEINNKLDDMVNDGTFDVIVGRFYKGLPFPYIGVITKASSDSKDKYHTLAISYDGVCFNEIPGYEYFAVPETGLENFGTDCYIFQLKDGTWLITATNSRVDSENDGLVCSTKDFKTFVTKPFNFGAKQYIVNNLGVSEEEAYRWVPQLFYDKDDNLCILMSWVYKDSDGKDKYNLDPARYFNLVWSRVTWDDEEKTLVGNANNFQKILTGVDSSMDGNILWDGDINKYRLVFKDRVNQWVDYGELSDLTEPVTIVKENMFNMVYTEAPIMYKCGGKWCVASTHYSNHYGYTCNPLFITDNFITGEFKLMNHYCGKYNNSRMRNIAPCRMDNPAILYTLNSANPSLFTGEYKAPPTIRFPKEETMFNLPLTFLPNVTYNVGNIEESSIAVVDTFHVGSVPLVRNNKGTLQLKGITNTTITFFGTQLPIIYNYANGSVTYSAYNYRVALSMEFKGLSVIVYSDYRYSWLFVYGDTNANINDNDSVNAVIPDFSGNNVQAMREVLIHPSIKGVITWSNNKLIYRGETIQSGTTVYFGNPRNTITA